MAAASAQDMNDYRHRTYDLKTPAEHRAMYDEWAASYDSDVMGSSTLYVGPKFTTEAVLANGGNIKGAILDAGCGTGLCGVALAEAGATMIDGIDVSEGMLAVAKKTGVYRELQAADMQVNLELESDKYDVVTCVGTFTTGHVGAKPALSELIRVLKKGGLLAATVLDNIWKPEGFETEVNRLNDSGIAEFVSAEVVEYRRADNAMSHLLVMRKR